jgi:hypothetical protein
MAELELRESDAGVVERVYYCSRTGSDYGVGVQFDSHKEACQRAWASIKRFDYGESGESFSRAWVETRYRIRWRPGGSSAGIDQAVESTELIPNQTQKEVLRRGGECPLPMKATAVLEALILEQAGV